MADEDLNPKMRYNPLWWKGWQFDDVAAGGGGGGPNVQNDLDMKGHAIVNVKNPVNAQDAATKKYVDDKGNDYVAKTGGVLTGDLNAGNQAIKNLKNPADAQDAATKSYVDSEGDKYVKKTGGQLTGNLDANAQKITGLGDPDPATDTDAVNVKYVKDKYLPKENGVLSTDLDANQQTITNLKTPAADTDAATKKYVDDAIAAGGGGKPFLASLVQLTPTNQIQGRNVQEAMDEVSREAAFTDSSVIFQETVTFNKPPKFAPGVQPISTQDVATLGKITELISAIQAAGISVDQTTPMTNLTATNVQDALQQADQLFGELSDILVENTSLVGTYNAKNNVVVDVLGSATGIVANQPLPAPDDDNKGMYVVVTIAGTGSGTAPAEALSPGDIIVSSGTVWKKVAAAQPITTLAASQVSIVAIAGINGSNVQEALASLASKSVTASNVSITAIPNLTGNNVQDALADAAGKIQTNATTGINLQNEITKLDGKIGALKATQVGFDNTTAAIPGNSVDTVQKAIDGVYTKFDTALANLNATSVAFTPAQGIVATNVSEAIKELKTNADNLGNTYITKTGGQLASDLDAADHKIVNVTLPTDNKDAANKQYVDTKGLEYVTKTGGQLTGALNANNQQINNVADGAANGDAINKGQLDAAIAGLSSQLTGKLTFIGTYNAQNNQIASLTSAAGAFSEYALNKPLPADDRKFTNHFFIVTVAGTGTAPAPTTVLNIGDLIYSSGSNWMALPLGTSRVAANVGITAIQQLPGVDNVQVALETLAAKPSGGAGTAATTTFQPAGNLQATNVQAALEELDTKKAADNQVVKLSGDQTIQGTKTFTSFVADKNITLKNPSADNTFTFSFSDIDQTKPSIFAINQIDDFRINQMIRLKPKLEASGKNYRADIGAYGVPDGDTRPLKLILGSFTLNVQGKVIESVGNPTNKNHAANKQYVDDAVAQAGGGIALEKLTDVDITASITSLSGKGTLTFSSRVMRDTATKDVISAMFGMKLTLTAPWNPGESTTPAVLAGCQINGEEYFKGLPVPVDSTLQGGSFKTVAQIQLIRVVPTSGVNLPQADSPLQIGRIVCKIDGGNTKLYAVFKHNSDIAVPTGTGAFFTVRYEGLPTMVI